MKTTPILCFSLFLTLFLTLMIMPGFSQNVHVGQIKNGKAELTTTPAKFNSDMSSIFPGKIYSNLQLLSATDSSGLFYYLKVDVEKERTSYPAVIILERIGGSGIDFISASGCEMKCSWTGSCTGCDQNIIVKCKSQKCTCNAASGEGFGGCSSSISFPD